MFINQISTPCQILIKEGLFNLSTMLNFKRSMDVPAECIQTGAYDINKRGMNLHDQDLSEGDNHELKELVNMIFLAR